MPKETFSSLQHFLFLGVLLGVTALFIWLLSPFVMSVFWALVLAIVLHPVFVHLSARMKGPVIAALTTILLTLVIVGVPLYFIGSRTAHEGLALYHHIASGGVDFNAITENPLVAKTLLFIGVEPSGAVAGVSAFIRDTSGTIAGEALSIGAATASVLLKTAITLYLLFFFLKDGVAIARYFQRIIPLGDERERLLFKRFTSTTRAVLKGTLIVSIAQGLIGTIIFLIAGVQSAVLWGVLMAFCAMIPAVGPFLVWLPIGLFLLVTGSVWQGALVLIAGAFIIGSVDNILRPILVGRDIEMPDALVLLSILGGIATFGVAGVIIGPVIGALFLSIWDLFGKDFSEEIALHG